MWTFEDIASAPRWESARTEALAGQIRGALLRDWASHISQRWGAQALQEVREQLGPAGDSLPDAPAPQAWVSVSTYLRLTEIIIDHLLDGDALALEPLLREDSLRNNEKRLRWLARLFSPKAVFRMIPNGLSKVYDLGAAHVEIDAQRATLAFEGAAFFPHPTWLLLQCFALRTLFSLSSRSLSSLGASVPSEEASTLHLEWS